MFSTIDINVLSSLNHLANSSGSWTFVTNLLANYLLFLIPVVTLVVIWEHHDLGWRQIGYRAVVKAILSVVLALAIGFIIEAIVGRVRPVIAHPDLVKEIGKLPGSSSMPSMHTLEAFSFSVALLLQRRTRKIGYWMVALAVLVAFGRLMAGAHYLTDVIVGALVGIIAAFVLVYEGSPLFKWLTRRGLYTGSTSVATAELSK